LAERVAASGGGWVLGEEEWEDDARVLDRIGELLEDTKAGEWSAASARAAAAPQPTLAAMAEATMALWHAALLRSPARAPAPPIAAERCLRALHYTPWTPPPAPAPLPAKPNGVLGIVARAALVVRGTPPGRLLYRLAPRPLVDALKQRL